MYVALLILIVIIGSIGIIARSVAEKRKAKSNPADAFDIIEGK